MAKMDLSTLEHLARQHPAWTLLRARHAPFVASFLYQVYVEPNVRAVPQADLVEALEDRFYDLGEEDGEKAFPRPALDYLNEWADSERGWLRKFYPPDTDEPHFDLTPGSEKAIAWLAALGDASS